MSAKKKTLIKIGDTITYQGQTFVVDNITTKKGQPIYHSRFFKFTNQHLPNDLQQEKKEAEIQLDDTAPENQSPDQV